MYALLKEKRFLSNILNDQRGNLFLHCSTEIQFKFLTPERKKSHQAKFISHDMKRGILKNKSNCDCLFNGCFCVQNITALCLSEQWSSLRWPLKGPFVPPECNKASQPFISPFAEGLCSLYIYWQASRIL